MSKGFGNRRMPKHLVFFYLRLSDSTYVFMSLYVNVSECGFAHNLDVYASIRCVCIFVSV